MKKLLVKKMGEVRKYQITFIEWMENHSFNEDFFSEKYAYWLGRNLGNVHGVYQNFVDEASNFLAFFTEQEGLEEKEANLAGEFADKVYSMILSADKIMSAKRTQYGQLLKKYEELVVPVQKIWQYLGYVAEQDPQIAEELRQKAIREFDPYAEDDMPGLLFKKD